MMVLSCASDMSQLQERTDHILRIPMAERDFDLVTAWRDSEGLSNFGLGKELARAVEEMDSDRDE